MTKTSARRTWCFRTSVKSGVTGFASRTEIPGNTVAANFIAVRTDFATRRETKTKRSQIKQNVIVRVFVTNVSFRRGNYLFDGIGSGQAHMRQS